MDIDNYRILYEHIGQDKTLRFLLFYFYVVSEKIDSLGLL
jgi:hypothetical protein